MKKLQGLLLWIELTNYISLNQKTRTFQLQKKIQFNSERIKIQVVKTLTNAKNTLNTISIEFTQKQKMKN